MGRESSMLWSTMREYNFIIQPILFQYLEVSSDCTLRKALPATAWAGRIIGCHYSVKCERLGASMFKFHSATPDWQLPNPNTLFSTLSVPPSQSANTFLWQMEHVITHLCPPV